MTDSAFASIGVLLKAYRDKTLSPLDVVKAQLERIRRHNPVINAFTLLDEQGALRAAKASEERWRRGAPIGPLDGISFTAKDNLMVAGYPWRRGSRTTDGTAMKESAPIVARCQEAGAVFLGLTTMPEFGFGPVTISPLTGITRNPWDTRKQAGGSSGGAAAGLAAGFSSLAIASDAGGSIRIPAALNGVVGLKPSGGRVPLYPPSAAGTLSCNGPITHTVEDAALVLGLASRADPRDPFAFPADAADAQAQLRDGIRGWKVAVSYTLGFAPRVHAEVSAAVRKAAAVLRDLGALVEEQDPGVEDPFEAYLPLLKAGFRHSLRNLNREQRELLSPQLREIVEGPEIALGDYLAAIERCQALARRMHQFHQTWDVLVTPTVAVPAFAAERHYPEDFEPYSNRRAWTPFTSLFNLTQQPAISVPAGLSSDGLPLGLHIAAARANDAKVLRAAAAYESASPFLGKPPACA